ncbi:DUF4097 domain-containing protein [Cesiribacter sp. SM1]|uniref:DUF4097 family beta strand repeat-containing protein n=1 Tax=Cesiribacter sp. SM1 TaxID=2861196 RepID=UPI001CD3A831|nr:DUF4097 domain-containing protein [Cesiribacter sp. SM1]
MKFSFNPLQAFILFFLLAGSSCAATNDFHNEPYWIREFSMNEPGSLEVQTSGGSITVEGHEGDKVRVEMHVKVRGRSIDSTDAKAQDALENYEFNISKSSNTVYAIAKSKGSGWFGNNNTSVSFRVYVPTDMACDLDTSGGSISISGVNGSQKVHTSGGSLNIVNIEGEMEAKTSGGSINIEQFSGALQAKTSGGTINLERATGDLDVSTSGGSIKLNDVAGRVQASTSGGSINANILELDSQLTLKTSGGSIHAVVPKGVGMDLDLKGNKVNTQLTNFDGQVEKDKIVGSINGGGVRVVMATSGGSVNLDYN